MSVGVAAHITAAAKRGPRFAPRLTTARRRSAVNGIWLCQTCAHLIDSDTTLYSVAELRRWKVSAEEEATFLLGRSRVRPSRLHLASASLDEAFRVIQTAHPSRDWNHERGATASFTSYRYDLQLHFVRDHSDDGLQCDDFVEPWANHFPDRKARGHYCDLYFGSSLLRRFVLVSVDGGRCYLPLPPSSVTLTVPRLSFAVARIHNELENLAYYFRAAGLSLEPGEDA